MHRERFSNEWSSKERAPVQQRHIAAYLAGSGGPPEMLAPPAGAGGAPSDSTSEGEFLRATQQLLLSGGWQPLLRTCYRRTAFQESSNNLVRVSLDTNLHMVSELGAPRAPGDWCR